MVVVDNARKMIGKTIDVVVTSVLQTTAGKMIFGRFIEPSAAAQSAPAPAHRDRVPRSTAAGCRRGQVARMPPFHWWRTVFFLIPCITRLHDRARHAVARARASFDRNGYFAHWCARTWSRLILATTGVRVDRTRPRAARAGTHLRVRREPSEHLRHPDPLLVAAVSAAHHRQGVARATSRSSAGICAAPATCSSTAGARIDTRIFGWAARLTSKGLSLIVFPEGTRSRDGRVARFKGGSFYWRSRPGCPSCRSRSSAAVT